MAELYGEIKVCKFQFFFYHTLFHYIQMKNVLRTIGFNRLFELVVYFFRDTLILS